MKPRRIRSKEEMLIYIRGLIISLLLVAFFAGIVLVYYGMLYKEKKATIIAEGELAAEKSAADIDAYLSTNIDSVKLTAYTLDEMITEKRPDEEIQEFLVGQSTAVKNSVNENMTGLYGYINGRFFSGTGWIPPEGYDATKRPWYTNPMENPGIITMLDPYVDVQTGNVMLAAGKTLSDGVSVISVDISLEWIQSVVEDTVNTDDVDIEMVLNEDGIAVAHSDKEEIGRDYSEDEYSLGGQIVKQLHETSAGYVEFSYENSEYVAYIVDMRDGWHSVSVKNSTGIIGSIKVTLIHTIVLIILAILVVAFFMIRMARKNIIAKNLSNRLSATADIYVSLYEIDLLNDTFVEVRNNNSDASELIGGRVKDARKLITEVMTTFSSEASRNNILSFVELSTLDDRLRDRNTITAEFQSANNKWRKARFIVSGRKEDGSLSRVMFMIENTDEEKKARERAYEAINVLNMRIQSIVNIYMTVHELDLVTDTFTEIRSESRDANDIIGENRLHAQETLRRVMETLCHESSLDGVLQFIDLSTLDGRLRGKDTISVEYMNKDYQWRRGRFVVTSRDNDGKLVKVLWMAEDIDAEKKERDRLLDLSERATAANEAKSAFLSSVSQELRNPINAMLGMNEMILRESRDESIREYSEKIEATGNKLLTMVKEILDFSGIEAGKLEIVPAEYDLPALVDEIASEIKPNVEDKGLSFILDRSDDLPTMVCGDRSRIKQIVSNILANAVKYTDKGSVILGVHANFPEDDKDSVILDIYVQDTGIGIKEEDIPEIFKKFERLDYSNNKNTMGIGLGMPITCKLLELMGSSLEVETAYGIGSKFYFSLKQKLV